MREIGEDDLVIADDAADLTHFRVGQLEKLIEQAELVHDLQRRRMDGVAAEVAQEIGMLLEHDHIEARAGEQEAEHYPGRSASGDRTTRRDGFVDHPRSEEHTSELQSLMRISYAVFCLKKKKIEKLTNESH